MDLIIRSQDGKAVVRNPSCLDVGVPDSRANLLWTESVNFGVFARFESGEGVVLGRYKTEDEARRVLEFIFKKLPKEGCLIYQMP